MNIDIKPESYSTLPYRWRVFTLVVTVFLCFCFIADPAPLKPLMIPIICFMAFSFLALLLSKVYVEQDRIVMSWSPANTILFWSDVHTLRFGTSIQPPITPIIIVTKTNRKKVMFPIHGMSDHNKRIIAGMFESASDGF